MPTPPPWQTTIAPSLVQRLMRPVTRPGVIGSALGDRLQARADRWANHLPLLTLAQRHSSAEGTPPGQTPIVYAQPQPPEVNAEGIAPAGVPQTTPAAAKPTVIQAKFAPGAAASPVLDAAPASPTPLVPRVQPQVMEGLNQPDAALSDMEMPWIEPLAQPELPMRELPVAELPVVVGRSPAPVQTADIAIAPPPPPSPPLPIVTAQPWGRPPELLSFNRSIPARPLLAAALGQPSSWTEPLPTQQRLKLGAVSFPGSALEPLQPGDASRPSPVDAAPDPAPLPRVRSVPPRLGWGQAEPLVFTQPGVPSAYSSTPPGLSGTAPLFRSESSLRQGTRPLVPVQGVGVTEAAASPSSVVRDIRSGIPDAAESPPVQAAAIAPMAPTVVSQAPAAPPPLDVDALAAQVERKLARRLAIERERRGWRP